MFVQGFLKEDKFMSTLCLVCLYKQAEFTVAQMLQTEGKGHNITSKVSDSTSERQQMLTSIAMAMFTRWTMNECTIL